MGDIKVKLPNLGGVVTELVAAEMDDVCGAFLWRMLCALPFGGWAAFPIQENRRMELVLWRQHNLRSVATTKMTGVRYELCTPLESRLCLGAQWEVKLQPTGQRCFFSPASLSSTVQLLMFLCQRQVWYSVSMVVLWLLHALCSHLYCLLYNLKTMWMLHYSCNVKSFVNHIFQMKMPRILNSYLRF